MNRRCGDTLTGKHAMLVAMRRTGLLDQPTSNVPFSTGIRDVLARNIDAIRGSLKPGTSNM
jgi:hypothetical protein